MLPQWRQVIEAEAARDPPVTDCSAGKGAFVC